MVGVPKLLIREDRLSVIVFKDRMRDLRTLISIEFAEIPIIELQPGDLSLIGSLDKERRDQVLILGDVFNHDCAVACLSALEHGYHVFAILPPDRCMTEPEIIRLTMASVLVLTEAQCLSDLRYTPY